jgi:hypothetical protein
MQRTQRKATAHGAPHSQGFPLTSNISFPEPSRALPDTLLTVEDVAERLAVSVGWVRDHAGRRTPALPVVRLGCLLRFRSADIDSFIAGQAKAPAQRKGRRKP